MRDNPEILLVDDDADFRAELKQRLQERMPGARITQVDRVSRAVDRGRVRTPDVLVFDLSIHPAHDFSLSALLRRKGMGMLVVALSRHGFPEYRQAAFKRAADAFLCKGADGFTAALVRIVRKHLDRDAAAAVGSDFGR